MNLSQQTKTFLSKIHETEVGIQNDYGKVLDIGDHSICTYEQACKPSLKMPRNKVFNETDLNAN